MEKLLDIDARIDDHENKEKDLQKAFLMGCDRRVRAEINVWYDGKRHEDPDSLPTIDTIKARLESLIKHLPKAKQDSKPSPANSPAKASSVAARKTVPQRLIPPATSSVTIGVSYIDDYRKLKLQDHPGLKELLIKEKRCFFCRSTTCKGVSDTSQCPELIRYTSSSCSSNPSLAFVAKGLRGVRTRTRARSSLNKIISTTDKELSAPHLLTVGKGIILSSSPEVSFITQQEKTTPIGDTTVPIAASTIILDEQDMEVGVIPTTDDTPLPKYSEPSSRRLFKGLANGNPITVLDDTGSDANILSKNYANKHGIPIQSCTPRIVRMADGSTTTITREANISLRINTWAKSSMRINVADIDEDLILGIPFRESIIVTLDDWSAQKFSFVTKNGEKHNWYGNDYQPRNRKQRHVAMIRPDQFAQLFSGHDQSEIFSIQVEDSKPWLGIHTITPEAHQGHEPTNEEQINNFLMDQKPEIREVLKNYLDSVFTEPPHFNEIPVREEDMKIPLQDGRLPRNQPLRKYTIVEDELAKAKITELLEKGWIVPSESPFGANLLFSKKKDGGLRMCIDYRSLNNSSIPDRTPLPSHIDLRERVRGKQYLSKVDIRDAFHMLRIDAPDRHKTAFKTKFGLFEYTVCPFGFTNSPAAFMRFMNRVFGDLCECGKFEGHFINSGDAKFGFRV